MDKMNISDKEIKVVFVDKNLKEAYETLRSSTTEDRRLYGWLDRAFSDIKKDYTCGILIPKRLIPRSYIKKYDIDNLFIVDLPLFWRMIYSLESDKIEIIAFVLDIFDHDDYNKRFGFKK